MPIAQVAGRELSDDTQLISEITSFASLLRQGSPASQRGTQAAVQWLPAGVLLEQLLADITIVYSPPKVGSTTVAATLNRHPAVRPEALHLHYLSQEGLARLEAQIAACSHTNVRFLQEHLVQARGVRVLLAANRALRSSGVPSVRKPYLIAGVREPVALYLSLAFEGWWLAGESPLVVNVESILAAMRRDPVHRICDDWFKGELATVFGIDVYSQPFPTDRGWDIYENDEARVLVIRQENLARLPEALGALYGLAPASFVVKTCNVGADKDYADHYALLKRTLRLTEPELDREYEAPYVKHFYTEQEIAGFRRRWSRDAGTVAETPSARPRGTPTTAAPQRACSSVQRPDDGSTPHIWVCRPCRRCEQKLNSIPGLQHTCAQQATELEQLRAANAALQEVAAEQAAQALAHKAILDADPIRGLARRLLPKALRSLARRMLGGSRVVPRG